MDGFDEGRFGKVKRVSKKKVSLFGFYRQKRQLRTLRALVDDDLRYYISAFFCVEGWGGGGGLAWRGGGNYISSAVDFIFSGNMFRPLICFPSAGSCVLRRV